MQVKFNESLWVMNCLNFQNEKKIVLDFYNSVQKCRTDEIPEILSLHYSENIIWRGFHPFNEIQGIMHLYADFWQPLKKSFTNLQRRMDIFFAGSNSLSSNRDVWVVSMGHLMGLFDTPWIGIKHTNKIAMLRYCEFNKIVKGKITEVAMFFDIPHLMIQAGLKPFPLETGISLVQPGPISHNGLLFEEQNLIDTKNTSELIEQMINDVKIWNNFDKISLIKELRKNWKDDMIWWGPTGIGSSFTIERYVEQHALPFRNNFINRKFNGHICRLSEVMFSGFFGWSNLTLTPNKKFMGLKTTKKPSDMRVIDIYRREGNKLAENWVFIDFLHFWKMQGIEILKC